MEKIRPLYDIEERYQNLWELCLDDNIDLDMLEAALQSVEGEIEEKVSNGIGLIQSLKNHSVGIAAEIRRLTQRQKAVDNRIKQLQTYYLDNLQKIGKSKVITSRGTMSIVKAGGPKPLIIDNENLVPLEYKNVIPPTLEVDKAALRKALESGSEIEGAHLEERKNYLKIW